MDSIGPSLMCPVSILPPSLSPLPTYVLCIFSTAAKTESRACIGVQSDFASVGLDRAPGIDAPLCAALGLVQSELHTRNYQ